MQLSEIDNRLRVLKYYMHYWIEYRAWLLIEFDKEVDRLNSEATKAAYIVAKKFGVGKPDLRMRLPNRKPLSFESFYQKTKNLDNRALEALVDMNRKKFENKKVKFSQ